MVDDVHVADGWPAQHERKADVPVGLGTGAEHGDVLHMNSFIEQTGGSEGSAEGCQCGRGNES